MTEKRHAITVKFFMEAFDEETPNDTAELLSGCLEEEFYEHSVLSQEDVTDDPDGGY